MAAGGVAKRYAVALYELAREKEELSSVLRDLERIQTELARDERFRRLFLHEGLEAEAKVYAVRRQLDDEPNELTRKFVGLVAQKRRISLFDDIVESFRKLVDEGVGVVEVRVKTAAALQESEQAALRTKLEEALRRQVRMSVEEVPSLIGGLRLQVGDYVVDGTLSGRLERLRQDLRSARIQKAG